VIPNDYHSEAGIFYTSENFLAPPYLTTTPNAWSGSATVCSRFPRPNPTITSYYVRSFYLSEERSRSWKPGSWKTVAWKSFGSFIFWVRMAAQHLPLDLVLPSSG